MNISAASWRDFRNILARRMIHCIPASLWGPQNISCGEWGSKERIGRRQQEGTMVLFFVFLCVSRKLQSREHATDWWHTLPVGCLHCAVRLVSPYRVFRVQNGAKVPTTRIQYWKTGPSVVNSDFPVTLETAPGQENTMNRWTPFEVMITKVVISLMQRLTIKYFF